MSPLSCVLPISRSISLLVQQQLARALGVVAVAGRRPVGRDVAVVKPDLPVADERVGVLEVRLAVAQRLHLAALERDARLPLLEQVVAKPRLAVGRRRPTRPACGPSSACSCGRRGETRRRLEVDAPARRLDRADDARRSGSPRRSRRPVFRPTSAVCSSFRSYQSPPIRRAGRKPSHGGASRDAHEADEGAGADHAGDLALEAPLPAMLGELALEQEREADVVGVALERHRLRARSRSSGPRSRRARASAADARPRPPAASSARCTQRSG